MVPAPPRYCALLRSAQTERAMQESPSCLTPCQCPASAQARVDLLEQVLESLQPARVGTLERQQASMIVEQGKREALQAKVEGGACEGWSWW